MCCLLPNLQVHEKIRENPIGEKKERSKPSEAQKKWKPSKLTYEERKAALKVSALTTPISLLTSTVLSAACTPYLLSSGMRLGFSWSAPSALRVSCYYTVGKLKAKGHRAYTQSVCSHICGFLQESATVHGYSHIISLV